jgi:hypothetical protein
MRTSTGSSANNAARRSRSYTSTYDFDGRLFALFGIEVAIQYLMDCCKKRGGLMRSFAVVFASCLALCAVSVSMYAQQPGTSVWAIDFVKPKEGQRDHYLRFIEANWIKAREEARKQGFILSYKVLVPPSQENDAVLLLLTEYADMKSYEAREENFKIVFAKIQPNGPTLINGLSSRQLADISSSKLFTEPVLVFPK